MRIAITGSTGFIGKWFIKLYSEKYELIALGRKPHIENSTPSEFTYHCTDYSLTSLKECLFSCDGLIHLASARIGNNAKSIEDYLENLKLAYNIFQACSELGIKNIVNASSLLVYGSKNSESISEDERPMPDTLHGISKLWCEDLAEQFNNYRDCYIKSLRIGQVFGTGDKESRLINHYIKKALNSETLEIFGNGSLKRNYIYVKDVCDALSASIENQDIKGAFNTVSNNIKQVREIAELINNKLNNSNIIKFTAGSGEFLEAHFYDMQKASTELNWKARWSFSDAIDDMITIMKDDTK
jgi:UDP-glucose 4-epimerase